MNLLFTSSGNSGSWQIRGEQLGAACGAQVQRHASSQLCAAADKIVVVKKCSDELLQSLRHSKRKWALDVLDFYPQPVCSYWSRDEAIRWVRNRIKELNPTAVIWPNDRMKRDCWDGRPALVLYHHYRPSIQSLNLRSSIQNLVYEGSSKYLGRWEAILQFACKEKGWGLLINPPQLTDGDVVVAFRDDGFNGYAQSSWKSNVKLVNAQAAGLPFIGAPEDGYTETSFGKEFFAINSAELNYALDEVSDYTYRQAVKLDSSKAFSIFDVAAQLKEFLYAM